MPAVPAVSASSQRTSQCQQSVPAASATVSAAVGAVSASSQRIISQHALTTESDDSQLTVCGKRHRVPVKKPWGRFSLGAATVGGHVPACMRMGARMNGRQVRDCPLQAGSKVCELVVGGVRACVRAGERAGEWAGRRAGGPAHCQDRQAGRHAGM